MMMIQQLIQDEADASTDEEERLIIIYSLPHLQAKINAPLRRGGSRLGTKNKAIQQMHVVVVMLATDYFVDNPTHTPKVLWQHLRMTKKLFMTIVIGARNYGYYLIQKKKTTAHDCPSSPHVSCIWLSPSYTR
jgi:ElaB/YqjD/DUF883 family membrane-anchored ribosome-binding protein